MEVCIRERPREGRVREKVSLDWVEPLSSGTPLKSRIDPPLTTHQPFKMQSINHEITGLVSGEGPVAPDPERIRIFLSGAVHYEDTMTV